MPPDGNFDAILKRIKNGQQTEALKAFGQILREASLQEVSQKFAKYNVHIQKVAGELQIDDRIYNGLLA